MKPIQHITAVSLLVLSACTTQNAATNVQSLAADTNVKQQVASTGFSTSLAPASGFENFGKAEDDRSFHADIAYYETVLSYGPVTDPRPLFLLTNAYIVSNQQIYGMEFIQRSLKRYENIMSDEMRAVYLSAYALLRGTYAEQVPLLSRIGWVLDTFDLLEEAERLAENNPLVHWSAGLVYAQVPGFFGKSDDAMKQLLWLVVHPELEPTPGFYREAYRYLAKLYTDKGDVKLAAHYLRKSGYSDYQPNTLFMGWFVTTKKQGLLFSPTPWIEEVVTDRVFAVRGFGFSDLHFVISADGQELISIDAGTQPDSMEAGYQFLMQRYPELPPLTTTIITHAHWDHVGGYSYLKALNSKITFYGRENYRGTVQRVMRNHTYQQFRGEDFQAEWVSRYQPDVAIDQLTTVIIGGSKVELIPVTGGETEDALLINLSELGVVFMGDALMPFYGEPWVEEGYIDEAVNTMNQALSRQPQHILHGHYGITVIYGNKQQLAAYRDAYQWLVAETRKHITNGYSAKDIIRLNLIPPGLQSIPQAFFSYLAPRDPIISRIADHMVGIWQEDKSGKEPGGLDTITSVEYGRLLEVYLDLSAGEVETMLGNILQGGDNQLALQMAVAAEKRYPHNKNITQFRNEAADRLRSAVQYFDPFKFVTYSELAGKEHHSIPSATRTPL